jgi:hypothetical protein
MAKLTPNKVLFFRSSSGDFSDELHVVDLTADIPATAYTAKSQRTSTSKLKGLPSSFSTIALAGATS